MTTSLTKATAVGTAMAAALAVGLAAAPAAPASAAPAGRAVGSTPSLAMAEATGRIVTLSTGEGTLVTLPRAISDVFVADDKVADVQPRTPTKLYVFGKGAGETTLSATDKSGAVVFQATVRVGAKFGDIGQMLRLTMADSQITSTTMNGMVILTGTVAAPDDIEEANRLVQTFVGKDVMVVSRLKTATPLQVMLRVRVAEVNRDVSQAIGVNFLTRDPGGRNSIGGGASQGTNVGTITPYTDPNTGTVISRLSQSALNAINGPGTRFGIAGHLLGLDVLAALDLAESNGYATTLAQPNLTALSGETASFLAGGEIPIPVPQFQGVTTIEYKQYGVSLAFTPTVLGDGRISLRVRPEVSQLTSSTVSINGYSIPGLTTRRAETTVELGSGQSFAIGGLLSNNLANQTDKAPFLGDLPIIGALFRSNSYRKSESELVIVITPYLVKPVSDQRIALPTDGFRTPTTLGRVLLDKQTGSTAASHREKPRADAPVTAQPASPPVAAADRRREPKTAAAAPGFAFN